MITTPRVSGKPQAGQEPRQEIGTRRSGGAAHLPQAPQPVQSEAAHAQQSRSPHPVTPAPAAPQSRHHAASQVLHLVQHSVRLTPDGQEVVVLGQAIDDTEQAFDHAIVTVKLYDSHGTYLNRPMPDELEQTAGDQIRPGDVVPFEWRQATPPGFASAVVVVTGVDPVTDVATPPDVVVSGVSWSDSGQGEGTRVEGSITNPTDSEVSVLLDVMAYDAAGDLIAFGSATFDEDYGIVLEPGATAQWTAVLDQPTGDIASVRTYLSGS